MKNAILFALAITLSLGACDKIEQPLAEMGSGGNCNPNIVVPRKVLVEDMTGHRCNNCPAAARTAEDINTFYDHNTVTVGLHVTSTFAAPILTNWAALNVPDSSYMSDYRCNAGNAVLATYTPTGLPAGLISRKSNSGSIVQGAANWFSATDAIVCQEADVKLEFNNLSYVGGTRTLGVEVNAEVRTPLTGEHRITIWLTEDHITDWQKDATISPEDIEFYDHRHVLRDKLDSGGNSTVDGAVVLTTTANVGDILTTSFGNYSLSSDYDENNCYLVAFISAPDGEVLQVEEIAIIP